MAMVATSMAKGVLMLSLKLSPTMAMAMAAMVATMMAMVATSMEREALTPNPTMATVALPVCPPPPLWLSTAMPLLLCPPCWVAMPGLAGMWLTPLAPSMWPRGRSTPTTMVAMAMVAMVWATVAMVATTMARGALMLKLSPTTMARGA